MAPRLSGHDARGSVGGAAQAKLSADNADRGGSLARRRIESSCGCARASQRTAEVGCSGLSAPIEASLEKRHRSRRHEGRRQGLASWEHLARSNPEREPAKAKGDLRSPRRRTSDVVVIRDGSALLARDKDGSFRKEAGTRIGSSRRRLLASEANVASRRVRRSGLRWFKPAHVRLRGRRARRGIADRGVRRRRSPRHRQANNLPRIERSRPSRLVGVNRRVSRKSPARVGCSFERREHGCREVERRTRLGGRRRLEVSRHPSAAKYFHFLKIFGSLITLLENRRVYLSKILPTRRRTQNRLRFPR
jgi:hypothetical protein